MHCTSPKPGGNGNLRSCGGCYACRINSRRVWTGRILLEDLMHPITSFVTLTYEDRHVPISEGQQVLYRKDYERFLRQFKRSPWGPELRYYGVAEYGDESARPHYHFILFGVGPEWIDEVEKAWSHRIKPDDVTPKAMKDGRIFRGPKGELREKIGYTTMDPLVPERAAYAARYVIKKMHKPDDNRLAGRPPEWRSMSKQAGGLGFPAVGWLADMHMTKAGAAALAKRRDVFNGIRVDGKCYPIGEYLRGKLREAIGWPSSQQYRDLEFDGYDDQELVFAPPMDLDSVRAFPKNRRLASEQKAKEAVDGYFKVEKAERRHKALHVTRGAKV